MTSGGGPEGYCLKCGEYSQSRTINHSGLCLACDGKKEKESKITERTNIKEGDEIQKLWKQGKHNE